MLSQNLFHCYRQWINDSYSFYENLLNKKDEPCGINEVSGYSFSSKDPSHTRVNVNIYLKFNAILTLGQNLELTFE